MSERLFTVDGAVATPAVPISLAEAGLRERRDLQEWVVAHPEILGSDVLVVSVEFGQWTGRDGGRELDRLDVLGIDSDGRLVIAELKRDRAPETVEMQAIKYAAMASRFTEENLAEAYRQFLVSRGTDITAEEARERLDGHCEGLEIETLRKPRIVLVARSFPPVVTSTAVWLTEMGIEITLQQVQAYRVFGDRVVVSVSQLFPPPEVEDFTLTPAQQPARELIASRRRRREKSTVVRLVSAGTLEDGTELTLRPTAEVAPEVREAITNWVSEAPDRGRAIWHNDRRAPLEWKLTGERARPTTIVQQILSQAAGLQVSVRGPAWWVTSDGKDLPTLAGPPAGGFDWTPLHQVLGRLPAARWTTYGDLAELIGTAPQPLGQHITNCRACPNAHRVLGADGRPREGFRWTDPSDTRTQEGALRAEGVRFEDGAASGDQRISADELEELLGSQDP